MASHVIALQEHENGRWRAKCECGWHSTWRMRRGLAGWAGYVHRQNENSDENGVVPYCGCGRSDCATCDAITKGG